MKISIRFDFKDHKKCLDTWNKIHPLYPFSVYLVVSTDFYTSGYWIESGLQGSTSGAYFYKTDEEVQALFERVRLADELRDSGKGGHGLIL